MKLLSVLLFIALLASSCGRPTQNNQIAPLYAQAAAPDPVTVIAPASIAQNPNFRFATDSEKVKWNEAYAATRVTAIPAANITQDASRRFITDAERTQWNKNASSIAPTNISPRTISLDANNRFVTDAQIKYWNTPTKLVAGTNIKLIQVNDSTIMVSFYIPEYNMWYRDRIENPPLGMIIWNTDTNKLNFRSSKKNWVALWSDQE